MGLSGRVLSASDWVLSSRSVAKAPYIGVGVRPIRDSLLMGGSVSRVGRDLIPGARAFDLSI